MRLCRVFCSKFQFDIKQEGDLNSRKSNTLLLWNLKVKVNKDWKKIVPLIMLT